MWLALETVEAATEIDSLPLDGDGAREELAAFGADLHQSNVSSIGKAMSSDDRADEQLRWEDSNLQPKD